MKMEKTVLFAMVAAALTSSSAFAAVDGGSGKITFTGDVISAPCAIKAEDVDKQVDLGEVPASYINSKGHSDAVDASIHLVDCDLPNSDNGEGTQTKVTKVDVTFTSTAVTTEGQNLLSNTMTGGATGVGVRLLDGEGQNITLGTAKTVTLVEASSEQTLPFQAYMELVDSTKATPATPGAVASNATYVLSYK